MANSKIKVTFLHPRTSDTFPVELGAGTTGQKALDELVKANFIEASNGAMTYALHLQRTNTALPLAAPLAASGAEDGDKIGITETSKGAGA
ncbi:MAG: hypothetical protein JWM10_4159 [Myxococcaceae bacterium]|nr:hypothetical protein [Myxococcaceae bacterium]